jgi:hypothetical protein
MMSFALLTASSLIQFGEVTNHTTPKKVKKVKVIPLQAWIGPEVSRSLRLPYFKKVGT